MTAELLAKIEEMNKMGLNDAIIAERLHYGRTTVNTWRKHLGLCVTGINRTKKRYVIYDGKTTQYIIEGSARECAEYMGITVDSFHQHKSRFRRGIYKKYEIYEVEE